MAVEFVHGQPSNPAEATAPVTSSEDPSKRIDNIDLSQATPNPDLLKERPIWETRGEIYAQTPTVISYVIRPYRSDAQGVKHFDRFDLYDPIKDHYYYSRTEYDKAREQYLHGTYPEKTMDVNYYPAIQKNITPKAPETIIFEAPEHVELDKVA